METTMRKNPSETKRNVKRIMDTVFSLHNEYLDSELEDYSEEIKEAANVLKNVHGQLGEPNADFERANAAARMCDDIREMMRNIEANIGNSIQDPTYAALSRIYELVGDLRQEMLDD